MNVHRPALVLSLFLLSCSGDAGGKANTPSGRERDTDIKHEECNGESSSAKRIDVNGDKKPDIIHVMNGSREACRIVDLNLDGAIDAFIYYDDRGQERRRESDFDRDGRADEISILVGGVIQRKERETNFDNKIDTWDYYEGGRLAKRERDSDGDKIIDQWWQFNNPQNVKCAIVATDRNADGKPDPDSVVDLCAESYGAPPKLPTPAAPAGDAGAPASGDAGAPTTPAGDAGAPASGDAGAATTPAADAGAAKPAGGDAGAAATTAGDAGAAKPTTTPKK